MLPENLPYTEKELLKNLMAGQEDAFRTIFNMFVAPLQYFAVKLIRQEQEAEDVVGFAFHKLWQQKNHFSSLPELRSFLYTIVRNQCIDILRHNTVKAAVHSELTGSQSEADSHAEGRMLQSELLRVVFAEIKALPERYRSILEWSFIEELSTAEMAARLNVSESHIRADKSRGLAMLRTALQHKQLLFTALVLYPFWENQTP